MKLSKRQSVFPLLLVMSLVVVFRALPGVASGPAPTNGMRKFVNASPHYVIYTDLPKVQARQAARRMSALFELYRKHAADLVGPNRGKLPVYLYGRFSSYRESLGPDDRSGPGRYGGVALRATVDEEAFQWRGIWYVLQHEGWHQFSHMRLRRNRPLPLWLEEGLADYFGEARWTGKRLVPGVIPPARLRRVQQRIRQGQFRPLHELVTMTRADWLRELNVVNSDQVWSFVQFLTHAHDAKYRDAFKAYLGDMVRGEDSLQAFRKRFGTKPGDLQKEYEAWWLGLSPRPTAALDDQITLETLVEFLTRLRRQGKTYPSAEAFFQAAREGKCNLDPSKPKEWLPPALLRRALREAKHREPWTLRYDKTGRAILIPHSAKLLR